MSLFRCGLRGLWLWLAAFCWLGRGIAKHSELVGPEGSSLHCGARRYSVF